VGADPVLAPVAGLAQADDLLHVPPAALGEQQLLAPGHDVFCGQFRVRRAEQVLPVQVLPDSAVA
jgi:hypothetical protein